MEIPKDIQPKQQLCDSSRIVTESHIIYNIQYVFLVGYIHAAYQLKYFSSQLHDGTLVFSHVENDSEECCFRIQLLPLITRQTQ